MSCNFAQRAGRRFLVLAVALLIGLAGPASLAQRPVPHPVTPIPAGGSARSAPANAEAMERQPQHDTLLDQRAGASNAGPNGRPVTESFGERFHAALRELEQAHSAFPLLDNHAIAEHQCCLFARAALSRYEDVYDKAEEKMRADYLGMPIDVDRMRFVYTTDDTAILGKLDASGMRQFERASGNSDWLSDARIARRLEVLRNELGEGGRVIIVGHQENGRIVIRDPTGDRWYDIAQLQNSAARMHLELLIWGCESARHAIGGVAQPFREGPLTTALIAAIAHPAATLGVFLDQISASAHVNWIFNAVTMMQLQNAIASVQDASGNQADVSMPAVPGNQEWISSMTAPSPATQDRQQVHTILANALQVGGTVFSLVFGLMTVMGLIFRIPGQSPTMFISAALLLALGMTGATFGVFALLCAGSFMVRHDIIDGMGALALGLAALLAYKVCRYIYSAKDDAT